jgi:predicted nuclease of predicted toxin-antitoxin system
MNGFYLDEHISRAVAKGLQAKGYNAIMAVDVGMESKDDDTEHLVYASTHHLVMVTFDHPFANRTQKRNDFYCLICLSHKLKRNIGGTITLLIEFAELFDQDKDISQVFYWS